MNFLLDICDSENIRIPRIQSCTRSELMKVSGQRWISNKPIENYVSFVDVEHCIDSFLDQYLYYLPVPRFKRTFENAETSNETLITAVKILFRVEGDDKDFENSMIPFVTHEIFKTSCSIIDFLRDPRSPLINQAYLVILMSINLQNAVEIPAHKLYKSAFADQALEIICDEYPNISINSLEEIFQEIHLRKQKVDVDTKKQLGQKLLFDHFLRAPDSWTRWTTIKEKGISCSELQSKVSSILEKASELTGISTDSLEPRVYLDDVISESPLIGFTD